MEPTEALPNETFKDWKTFLTGLFKDAWKVYPKYSLLESGDEKDMQLTFETLCRASEEALFDLLDMQGIHNRKPSQIKPSQRKPLVDKLRKLVTELDAALDELGPPPNVAEVYRVEEIHKADETQETREVNEAHQAEDADGVNDAIAVSTAIAPVETVPVPLLGRIAAGGPILAEGSIEDIFPLPRQLVGEGELFLLKVTGDSMINASIASGDWVVVRQQPEAENGQIVAAIIDGEATVKTFNQSGEHTWLVPNNPTYAPILADEATILGKVVAVLRRVR
jgi:repressor LexA